MDTFALTPEYTLDLSDLTRTVDSVSADFTLLDLVRMVFEAERRWPGIAAAFDMGKIDAFYAEVTSERDADDDDNLHYLELYWSFDYDAEVIPRARRWNRRRPKGKPRIPDVRDTPGRGTMPNLMSFHGIGRHWEDKNIPCDDRENCGHHRQYGISLTSLNNLAHLPIRMDTAAKVYRPALRELRHPIRRLFRRLGRIGRPLLARWDRRLETPVMTIEVRPTLHTFLSSVLWELTFGGRHPDDRDARLEELRKSCEEAREESERGRLIPLDDVLDQLDGMFDDEEEAE